MQFLNISNAERLNNDGATALAFGDPVRAIQSYKQALAMLRTELNDPATEVTEANSASGTTCVDSDSIRFTALEDSKNSHLSHIVAIESVISFTPQESEQTAKGASDSLEDATLKTTAVLMNIALAYYHLAMTSGSKCRQLLLKAATFYESAIKLSSSISIQDVEDEKAVDKLLFFALIALNNCLCIAIEIGSTKKMHYYHSALKAIFESEVGEFEHCVVDEILMNLTVLDMTDMLASFSAACA
jgi:hypothetical protein